MQLLLAGRCNSDLQTMDGHTELQNGKFHYCRRLAEEKEAKKVGKAQNGEALTVKQLLHAARDDDAARVRWIEERIWLD
jgi:hypothetical protein